MHSNASLTEGFLTAFHDERPGSTSGAYASLPVTFQGREYPSSYEVLASVLPARIERARVLDLACGDGYLLSLLAARAGSTAHLSGVDMSNAELQRARSRLGSSAALSLARAQALPFADATFDHVLCHLALMLMDDAERVVAEIRRVLKPDGVLAAVVGASPPPSPGFDAYMDVFSKHARQPRFRELRFGDRRFRSAAGIQQLLSARFADVAMGDIGIRMRLTPQELWRWLLDMYDLYLLDAADRQSAESEYLSAVSPSCGADGKVAYEQTLRFFSAKAA